MMFAKTMIDFTAKSGNHEGHKETQRKCASCLFAFVRFVSLVVKSLSEKPCGVGEGTAFAYPIIPRRRVFG